MKPIDLLHGLTVKAPGRHLHQLEGYIAFIAETCGPFMAQQMAAKRGIPEAYTARIIRDLKPA